MTANEFYASLSGKRITFVGVGRSNLPLIEQFKPTVQPFRCAISAAKRRWAKTAKR